MTIADYVQWTMTVGIDPAKELKEDGEIIKPGLFHVNIRNYINT